MNQLVKILVTISVIKQHPSWEALVNVCQGFCFCVARFHLARHLFPGAAGNFAC